MRYSCSIIVVDVPLPKAAENSKFSLTFKMANLQLHVKISK